jgi:glutamine synthetase
MRKLLDHIMDVIALITERQDAMSSQELQSALMLTAEFLKVLYHVNIYQFCHLNNKYRYWKQDSAIGIATGYGLDNRRIGVRIPVNSRYHSDSATHPTSYPLGTGPLSRG